MSPNKATRIATILALLYLPLLSYANTNVTMRFFPHDSSVDEDTCSYADTSNALSFTTSSVPFVPHCFNFADLFGNSSNATTGFINQTDRQLPNMRSGEDVGIHYRLSNIASFDPRANYSTVLYRQHFGPTGDEDREPGAFAWRRMNVYGAPDCNQASENGELLDWFYGFNCWSEDEGRCGTTPWSVASFTVHPVDKDEEDGTCLDFAKNGGAADGLGASKGWVSSVAAVLVGALLVM